MDVTETGFSTETSVSSSLFNDQLNLTERTISPSSKEYSTSIDISITTDIHSETTYSFTASTVETICTPFTCGNGGTCYEDKKGIQVMTKIYYNLLNDLNLFC